jgi:secernin
MCDTILALPGATASGGVLFGKNSDRERNEAQAVESFARTQHADGAWVQCTYIAIPQVRQTFAVLLCRPFWIWGAEMGANEHGVVIGNEAVHSRVPPQRENALIGMDLLRLGLERAASAAEAVEVITTLLEQHGQGGSCGHQSPRYYHNSFIIADRREAYVLETVGRMWAIKLADHARAISNAYSIGRNPDRTSASLVDHARTQGWCREVADLDVAAAFSDLKQDAERPDRRIDGLRVARRSDRALGDRNRPTVHVDLQARVASRRFAGAGSVTDGSVRCPHVMVAP